MKVPKMYKSSDRYNAGTDVVYNDDSKLQYAPFIYATVTAKDNGDDGGDEEGEDSMVVIYDSEENAIDKSFKELKDAVKAGKIVVMNEVSQDDETGFGTQIFYLTYLDNQTAGKYHAYFTTVYSDGGGGETEMNVRQFDAENETDNMILHQAG